MTLLLDSSAIFNLYTEGRYASFLDAYTTPLARYELGNAVWKRVHLAKTTKQEEGQKLLDALDTLYLKMNKITEIDTGETLKLADENGITYYDASYITTALDHGLTLITDDTRLRKTASKYLTAIDSQHIPTQ
jgi:predicted nucleic acid-binding protein